MEQAELESLANACARLNRLKEKKKELNSEYGRRIKDVEKEIRDLSSKVPVSDEVIDLDPPSDPDGLILL